MVTSLALAACMGGPLPPASSGQNGVSPGVSATTEPPMTKSAAQPEPSARSTSSLPMPGNEPSSSTTSGNSDLARLPDIVLSNRLVPDGFKQTFESAYTRADIAAQGTYSAAQLREWNYLGGYEREFERQDPNNPVKISSDAGAYGTIDGIRSAFGQNSVNCQIGGWKIVTEDVGLGVGSLLCSRDTSFRGRVARVYFLVWWKDGIKSAVTVTALLNKSSPALVLDLARRQAANY